ncbi:MAG: hypothetical protein EA396_06730 [Anaerolineaceae bacterium]|nr:MAG: hypothetical protein EA396_06730 [Anaerolineaceae bacterium]
MSIFALRFLCIVKFLYFFPDKAMEFKLKNPDLAVEVCPLTMYRIPCSKKTIPRLKTFFSSICICD